MNAAGNILEVRDVEVTFRVGPLLNRQDILAVAGVSFGVRPGETFALVGESGSGKTTLARAINGLQPISNGSVQFDGQRIDTLSAGAMKPLRRDMAMMFQDPVGSLSPRRTQFHQTLAFFFKMTLPMTAAFGAIQ